MKLPQTDCVLGKLQAIQSGWALTLSVELELVSTNKYYACEVGELCWLHFQMGHRK